jgi:hypothetical protein
MKWAEENEKNIWKYFVEQKLLFKSDELLKLVKSSATEKVKMSDEADVSGQDDLMVSIDEL